MRSRWSAFALGLGGYLVDTLSRDHPDQAIPRAALERELSRLRERQRFLRLAILDAAEARSDEVLFYARIFEKGSDRSFVELSSFVVEDDRWRYASGVLLPTERLPEKPDALDRAAFLGLVREPTG